MSVCVTDLGHRRQLSGYPQLVIRIHSVSQYGHLLLHLDHWGREEGGKEGGREGGREGWQEGGREFMKVVEREPVSTHLTFPISPIQ